MNFSFSADSHIKNETLFYSWLSEYLNGPGKTFKNDVVFMNTTNGKRISVGDIKRKTQVSGLI